MTTASGPQPRALATGVFCFLWIASIIPGVIAVHGLEWPYDLDGFRDIAVAQALLDGSSIWSDPLYRGETAWYNPLVPAIVAAIAAILNSGVPETLVRAGALLNAAAPAMFFLCGSRLVGPLPALAAACAFMFLPGRPPAWAAATYSPWLFPAILAHSLLYLGIAVWTRTLMQPSTPRLALSGVLVGLTFLAHTGAGLVLGGIVAATALSRAIADRNRDGSGTLRILIVPLALSVIVAGLFVVPLLVSYRLQILNDAPAVWLDEPTMPRSIVRGMTKPGALLQLALMVWGFVRLRQQCSQTTRAIVYAWTGVAGALYGYSVIATLTPAGLQPIVPAYHFYFILRALKWLLLGYGLIELVEFVRLRLSFMRTSAISTSALVVGCVLLVSLSVYPRYLGREAFTRAPALARQSAADELPVYRWIRTHTNRDAVFLSSDIDALRIVAPAGRQVVSVYREFSNPYVDYSMRAAARDQLMSCLPSDWTSTCEALRRQFGVTHVLVRGEQENRLRSLADKRIAKVFGDDFVSIFEIQE